MKMQSESFAGKRIAPVASVNVSRFEGAQGVEEYHLTVSPTGYGSIEAQLRQVLSSYREALESLGLDTRTAIFRRFFCSDISNQTAALEADPLSNPQQVDDPCAVSWIGQPGMPPVKLALWAYHVNDPLTALDKRREGATLCVNRGDLTHHWTTGLACPDAGDAEAQTRAIFQSYDAFLESHHMTLVDHAVRTWLFVRDVDGDYQQLVKARREFFAEHGLTSDTHYIASTGIAGAHQDVAARVAMDVYAVSGLRREQITFLAAPDHLSPTHLYGVTFERGVSIAYRDRKHVYLSGTASIDSQGRIVHPGDVSRQLDRTLENMEALLNRASATLDDMRVFIVYLRDPADYPLARQRMRERFGDVPIVTVVAPVCRPGWLIELEGMAVVHAANPDLPAF